MLRRPKISKEIEESLHKLEEAEEHIQQEIEETQQEIEKLQALHHRDGWLTYVGLSTSILAVFAVLATLDSNQSINLALISQIKASDKWSQYQSAREKEHLYGLFLDDILDKNPDNAEMQSVVGTALPPPKEKAKAITERPAPTFKSKSPLNRANEFFQKVTDEHYKEQSLSKEAGALEIESKAKESRHHLFEVSVGLLEITICLGGVAGLIRSKRIWFSSLVLGVSGAGLYSVGALQEHPSLTGPALIGAGVCTLIIALGFRGKLLLPFRKAREQTPGSGPAK